MKVGVISTLVWDVIYRVGDTEPAEGWGGATYSLSALDAALNDEWTIAPIMKVGRDRAPGAHTFLRELSHLSEDAALKVVNDANNCSEIRYYSEEHRDETLSGHVPAWSWAELSAELERARPDALYVNFLSGWEFDLETARQLRATFQGPIYADIHMMVWKPAADGKRILTAVDRADEWFACFDYVQVNVDEMRMLADDTQTFGRRAVGQGARLALVTQGKAGVRWFTTDASGFVEQRNVREGRDVDPTGCGDVWGATAFARLLQGDDTVRAIQAANEAASRNAAYRGVIGLREQLRGPAS